jgi:hypothetical protein
LFPHFSALVNSFVVYYDHFLILVTAFGSYNDLVLTIAGARGQTAILWDLEYAVDAYSVYPRI